MRKSDRVREALIEAGTRLLEERPPSAITGRELAEAAGVNYGLVHHYFGGKEGVLREAVLRLRDEFLARHPEPERLPLLVDHHDPFLTALVRGHVDHPNGFGGDIGGHPIGTALVDALRARLVAAGDGDDVVEAKARAIALMALQLTYGVFKPLLLDAAEVGRRERAAVEQALSRLYDQLALVD